MEKEKKTKEPHRLKVSNKVRPLLESLLDTYQKVFSDADDATYSNIMFVAAKRLHTEVSEKIAQYSESELREVLRPVLRP